jgi:hypothetical protein
MKRALKRSRPEASRARREKASGKRGAEINMPDPHLAYCSKELAGAPMYLELPTDRPRSSAQNSRMATYRFALPTSLALSLRNLSRCEQTTVFMTLVAGFTVLLHRYTGQDDILAGSPMFGGKVAEDEGWVSEWINTVVLRVRFIPDLTSPELLRQIRQTTSAAYAHRHLAFQRLLEELRIRPAASHHPIFQVMFRYASSPERERKMAGQAASLEFGLARCDLTLPMVERRGRLRGALKYGSGLFDAATIERMAGHFQTLLEGMVGNPDQRVADLGILTKAESINKSSNGTPLRETIPNRSASTSYLRSRSNIHPTRRRLFSIVGLRVLRLTGLSLDHMTRGVGEPIRQRSCIARQMVQRDR